MDNRRFVSCRSFAAFLVVIAASLVALGQDAAVPQPAEARPTLDEGLLDPEWFGGGAAIEFRTANQVDYLWVKPGFELRGKRVKFGTWEEPRLPATRDAHDAKAAKKFNAQFPPLLRETLSTELNPPVVPVETDTEAEVLFVGRVADCNAGAGPFVWPNLVIDVKVLDARTGELLAAIHNRKVRSMQAFQHATVLLKLSTKGFQAVYASATPATQ